MKTKFLIILFTLNYIFSYSQDFERIKIDSKLQVKYSDTLKNIKERLTGKWKYLGKKANGSLKDTIGVSFRNDKKTLIIVENGYLYEITGNKKKEADYFYEITYSFENKRGYYNKNKKYHEQGITEINEHPSFPKIIFYKNRFGIFFSNFIENNRFYEIKKLTFNRLVLENGKEYLKLK